MNTAAIVGCERKNSTILTHVSTWFMRVLGIAAYLCMLFWVYVNVLAPHHTFFAFNKGSTTWSWTAFVLALAPILLLPMRFRTISDGILWVIYLLIAAPSILLVQPIIGIPLFGLAFGLIVALALAACVASLPPLALPRLELSNDAFLGLLLMIWCVSNGYLLAKYGITAHLPSLGHVYAIRAAFYSGASPLVIYVVNWTANVVNVLLLIVCMHTKGRRSWLLLAVLSQLDMYGLTSYKIILVPLVLVPTILLIKDVWWRRSFAVWAWGLMALLVIGTLAGYVFSPIVLGLIDRGYLAPPALTALYYQYFQQHPLPAPVYAGFRWFYGAAGPYQAPQYIIGSLAVFPIKIDANANLFADGYANFGWWGFVIIGLMLGVCLWFIKAVCRGLELRVTIALFFIATLALVNAGLPTALLTHGLFFTMVFAYLMPRPSHLTSFRRQ